MTSQILQNFHHLLFLPFWLLHFVVCCCVFSPFFSPCFPKLMMPTNLEINMLKVTLWRQEAGLHPTKAQQTSNFWQISKWSLRNIFADGFWMHRLQITAPCLCVYESTSGGVLCWGQSCGPEIVKLKTLEFAWIWIWLTNSIDLNAFYNFRKSPRVSFPQSARLLGLHCVHRLPQSCDLNISLECLHAVHMVQFHIWICRLPSVWILTIWFLDFRLANMEIFIHCE